MDNGSAWNPPSQPLGQWPPPSQWPPPGQWPPPQPAGYGAPWPPPAPKPGVIPLRPVSLGEILDGSITTIRRNPKPTLGFSAVIMAVSTVVTTALATRELPGLQRMSERASIGQPLTGADVRPFAGWLAAYGVVSLLLSLAVSVILSGTLTAVVGRAVLGQQGTLRQAWQQARGRIGALHRLILLLFAMFIGLWLVLIGVPLLGAAAAPQLGLALTIPAVLAAIPLTVFLWVKTSLAASAVVLERANATGAIGRSWRLTRKSFWRLLGVWIVSYLAILVAGLVLDIPFRILTGVVTGTASLGFGGPPALPGGGKLVAYFIIMAVGSLVAATVTRPMLAGVAVLLYVDLRMRREGLDMALQTAAEHGDDFSRVWQVPPARGPW